MLKYSKLVLLLGLTVFTIATSAKKNKSFESSFANQFEKHGCQSQKAMRIKHRGVYVKNVSWKAGQDIDVYFTNGTKRQKKIVEYYASQWTKYANIKFIFHHNKQKKDNKLAVVVKFDPKMSACGTSSLGSGSTSAKYPSVHLKCVGGGTIIHEFGHTLGLTHEQYNYKMAPYLDKKEAYKYFKSRFKWSKKDSNNNIFNPKNVYYQMTDFDFESVMGYPIYVKVFKTKDRSAGGRDFISNGDKKTISKIYPGRRYDIKDIQKFGYYDILTFGTQLKNTNLWVYINNKLVFKYKKNAYVEGYAKGKSILKHMTKKLNKVEIFTERLSSKSTASVNFWGGSGLGLSHGCYSTWCDLYGKNGKDRKIYYFENINATGKKEQYKNNDKLDRKRFWFKKFDCGEYGDLKLSWFDKKSKEIKGKYSYRKGFIFGNLTGKKNQSFTGAWNQKENNQSGKFLFTMSKNNKSLVGLWKYDDEKDWRKGWNCKVK